MLAEERFLEIVRYVDEKRAVTVQELTELLHTSESTIRRDLTELQKRGSLIKVHGGATTIKTSMITKDEALDVRRNKNIEEKQRIGAFAATLIENNDFVYLDAGSSVDIMIDYLTCKEAVYVTNAVGHAGKLLKKGCQVLMIGGRLKGTTEAIVGAEAVENLQRYNFTKGFFGTNGIDNNHGCTTPDSEEAQIKKVAMERCMEKYVLADSSKFDKVTSVTFSDVISTAIITTKLKDSSYKKYNITEVQL